MDIIKELPVNEKKRLCEAEREFVKNYIKRLLPMALAAIVTLTLYTYLVINKTIDFSKYTGISAENLIDFPSRIKFVLLHLTLGIVWVFISINIVIFKRLGTPALDPMNGYECLTLAAKNNLTNSLEHFTISAVSQLILVIDLEAETILYVIPALNLIQLFGRIAFWLGYPTYRGFGFSLFYFPVMATIGYNSYQLTKLYC